MSLFPIRRLVRNPRVILPRRDFRGVTAWEEAEVVGEFYHVIPSTPKEIQYLTLLKLHWEKYAPAEGAGVLLRLEALTGKN